ncbi:sensor histidine kinase [Nitrincola sp. MINF-07-Sa-05]|uniref:sensor histidine kinase n=1 Tax=Nitrincola salilacus TaxID=3400273 RepID=UPI003918540C
MNDDSLQEPVTQAGRELDVHLIHSEKMASIGQLAAGVAHEINNPVGYVFSNLKIMAKYIRDMQTIIDTIDTSASLDEVKAVKRNIDYDYIKQDLEDMLGESVYGVETIIGIVSALKDFSYDDGDEFKEVDLYKGLNSTLSVVNNEIKYKAEVVKQFSDLPLVECIPSKINQVFMNLLVNAAHAIEDSGVITLTTGVDGDRVWFEVADDGVGMDEATLSRIYEPFFTTKPPGQGTGLGLAICYSILKKHDATLEVVSEPGVGTTFKIYLPIKRKTSVT